MDGAICSPCGLSQSNYFIQSASYRKQRLPGSGSYRYRSVYCEDLAIDAARSAHLPWISGKVGGLWSSILCHCGACRRGKTCE